nr:hypothetical protein [Brevibacillus massiliensis]
MWRTSEPLALLEASYLTALRTGAATGLATKHLARSDAKVLGVIGTGVQSRGIISAIREVRSIEFCAEHIGSGVHVNAVGSFRPDMQELPGELFVRRPKVVVESVEAALEETGDLLIPMEQGLFSESLLYAELGDIVAGKKRAAKIGKKLRFLSRSGWLQWML